MCARHGQRHIRVKLEVKEWLGFDMATGISGKG